MDVPAPTVVSDELSLKSPVAPPRRIEIDRRTFLQGTSATAVLLAAASAITPTACAAAPALKQEPWDDGTFWDDGTGWIP